MAELLFEIFCEEIPARMQQRAGQDLSKALVDGLKKAGLTVEGEHCYTGPRRLVFTADIPQRSPDISEERKGPRVGSPEQALAGFMRGAGLSDISEAQIRTGPKKGDFYVAVIEKSGMDSADILKTLIPEIMTSFPWPKSMKSGTSTFRWVRPLRSVICLLAGKLVEFEVGGVKSGAVTEGHRRHGKGTYTVKNFKDYRKQLEGKGHVMICSCERKDKILTDARAACAAKGLELVEDEGLLNEVAGLAEWPVVILGDMDPKFLELPDEVIRLTLKTHQKTFTVRDPKTGNLAAHYIIVANQEAPDGGAAIKAGNGKVISARLSDAQFFQSEDAKKKLIDYYDKLDTVVFHKKLGSIRDKAERVAALAKELAPKVGADPEKAEQAAKLAKCDLVTQTVVEFTSLQGQIGSLMYERESGDSDIATAIEQHYKPQGPSDAVPINPVAVAVALADKLDTLSSFWAIPEKPTGSKDPYALRRAALGVIRIVVENNLRVPLFYFLGRSGRLAMAAMIQVVKSEMDKKVKMSEFILQSENPDSAIVQLVKTSGKAAELLASEESMDTPPQKWELDRYGNLLAFILDRLKVYLRDQGKRHDIIDAVLASGGDDLVAIVNRTNALQSFLETPEGENLLAGYKRAANILKAEAKKGDLPKGALEKPSEKESVALFKALQTANPKIESALKDENYTEAMSHLAVLRGPIDAFFTHVQVISDDTAVKSNNLRLLLQIRDTARQIADFDKISG